MSNIKNNSEDLSNELFFGESILFDNAQHSSGYSNASIFSLLNRNPNIRSPLPNPDSRWTSDKSTQTDATIERQAGSWIAELKTQIDSLINDLKMTSESYIPNAEGNQEQEIESARISMGDVHLDQILYPAVCSDNNVSSNSSTTTLSFGEYGASDKAYHQTELLKERLHKITKTACDIKNIIFLYQNGPPVFPPPTGAVVTPSTQTEPIDTYVEFLKVIDFAAEYNAKMGSKSKANHNQPSPKRLRCKAPTATSKSFSRDSNIKPKSINTHCGNMVRCSSTVSISQQLENVLDETLNRKKVKKWSQQDRHFDLSPCNFSDIAEPRRPRQGSSTTDSSETELHNPFEMNKEHEQLESLTKNSHSSSDTDTAEESSAFHVLASTLKDKESFSLLDFISTMRQVNARSPETKRSRRVSDTPKAHFDFDDYYEKLINMKNTYKSKADSNVSKLISDLTLKSAQIMLNKF